MITIGYSTRSSKPEFKKLIQKTCMFKEVEIIEKVNNGKKSLSEVYNEIIKESTNNIVVLCHELFNLCNFIIIYILKKNKYICIK